MLAIFLLIGALVLLPSPRSVSAQKETGKISESAARQIMSLIQEKESRTEAQKRSTLNFYALKQDRDEAITSAVRVMGVKARTCR
jgi:hypothetical protein